MTTREVLESFFDFRGKLNEFYSIIPSLYCLIERRKKVDEPFFIFLNKQIDPMLISNEFHKVVQLTMHNIMHDCKGYDVDWTIMAYLFHSLDRINTAAKIHLNSIEYETFKTETTNFVCDQLEDIYGSKLGERQWAIFSLAELTKTLKVKPEVTAGLKNVCNGFLIALSVYILNKAFKK